MPAPFIPRSGSRGGGGGGGRLSVLATSSAQLRSDKIRSLVDDSCPSRLQFEGAAQFDRDWKRLWLNRRRQSPCPLDVIRRRPTGLFPEFPKDLPRRARIASTIALRSFMTAAARTGRHRQQCEQQRRNAVVSRDLARRWSAWRIIRPGSRPNSTRTPVGVDRGFDRHDLTRRRAVDQSTVSGMTIGGCPSWSRYPLAKESAGSKPSSAACMMDIITDSCEHCRILGFFAAVGRS